MAFTRETLFLFFRPRLLCVGVGVDLQLQLHLHLHTNVPSRQRHFKMPDLFSVPAMFIMLVSIDFCLVLR